MSEAYLKGPPNTICGQKSVLTTEDREGNDRRRREIDGSAGLRFILEGRCPAGCASGTQHAIVEVQAEG
jgi:hypothetical protein